jgi:tetratricopeptide (TPR) repeat protein
LVLFGSVNGASPQQLNHRWRDGIDQQQTPLRRCAGRSMKPNLRLVAFIVLAVATGRAEPVRSDTIVVRGEITSSSPIASGLSVELAGNGVRFESAFVGPDNSFEFRSVTPGVHELRVVAANGQVLYQEYVSVAPNQTLSIRLPDQPRSDRSGESTISLQQLRHKVPAAAQKAFQKGERAAAKGDLDQARTCFEEAVARDPEFADAYNELGGADAGLNRLEEAAAQFQKAIDLVPEHRRALPNLSIVFAKMERFHEAGQVARRALQVVPGDGRMHYILAASLVVEHGNIDAILPHLERAAADVPSAHLTAADLLAQCGRFEEAIHHLEDYLNRAAPGDSSRPKAEARLAQLRQRSPSAAR